MWTYLDSKDISEETYVSKAKHKLKLSIPVQGGIEVHVLSQDQCSWGQRLWTMLFPNHTTSGKLINISIAQKWQYKDILYCHWEKLAKFVQNGSYLAHVSFQCVTDGDKHRVGCWIHCTLRINEYNKSLNNVQNIIKCSNI